ncbi:hypothetical protein [Parasphingorhabdus sp.]|uniref:hypothetical protein n=1 Tax=Parasphingorhabdus sp. TaxID=2709688 RepID=UPI0030015491
MSAHTPLLPSKAIKLVEEAGLAEAQSILADYAAAGLVKTYALMRTTISAGQAPRSVRDAAIPAEVWQRIIADGKTAEALNGGTARLAGSDLIGGEPDVQITGIRFSDVSLGNVLGRYCSEPKPITSCKAKKATIPTQPPESNAELSAESHMSPPEKVQPPIRGSDLTATIAQVMQSTGIGRTKINDLMNNGTLVRKKIGSRTVITVESIKRYFL